MPANPTPEERAAWRDMALRLSDPLAVASSDDFEAICSAIPRLLDALETSEAKVKRLREGVQQIVIASECLEPAAYALAKGLLKETE